MCTILKFRSRISVHYIELILFFNDQLGQLSPFIREHGGLAVDDGRHTRIRGAKINADGNFRHGGEDYSSAAPCVNLLRPPTSVRAAGEAGCQIVS